VDFKQAVERLLQTSYKELPAKTTDPGEIGFASHGAGNKQPTTDLSVKELKLLSKVIAYYQHTFTQDSRGIEYLKQERGITDPQSFKDFRLGYTNGTLLDILPHDPKILKTLKKIGILNQKGHDGDVHDIMLYLKRCV